MAEEIRKQQRPDNITGINKVEYLTTEEVESIQPTGPESKEIVAADGTASAEIKLTGATGESVFTEGTFENRVSGVLQDWSNIMGVSLWQLAHKRFVVVVTDAQGRRWGLGTKEEPLRMTYRRTNGDTPAKTQGTEITFSNKSTEGFWGVA